MTPDPITPVMQAAERLRRLKAGETPMAVYQDGVEEIVFVTLERNADWMTLADFALSILPKGERPVPVPADAEWTVFHDHTGEHYLTDEDSTAVLHWEAWIDFQDRLRGIHGDH